MTESPWGHRRHVHFVSRVWVRLDRRWARPVATWSRAAQSPKHMEEMAQVLVSHIKCYFRHRPRCHPKLKGRLLDPPAVHVFARRDPERRPHNACDMLRGAPGKPEERRHALSKRLRLANPPARLPQPVGRPFQPKLNGRAAKPREDPEQEMLEVQPVPRIDR